MEQLGRLRLTRHPTKGIACVLIAWIFFTIAIALSRPASESSSVPTVLFFQNLISLIVTIPWLLRKGKKSFYIPKFGLMLVRALAGYLSFAFAFLAIQRTSLVNVVLLNNSAPLFIPLIIWFWKRKKLPRSLWMGILLGFIGIAIILKPNHEIVKLGGFFGLAAGICLAFSMIAQRRLVKTEPIYTILFYYFLISTLLSLPFSIDAWKTLNSETLLQLLGIGLCFATGQHLFFRASRYEKPSFLAPFNYSAVVYGAIIQWLIWSNIPSWSDIIGVIIVCVGGIITIAYNKRAV